LKLGRIIEIEQGASNLMRFLRPAIDGTPFAHNDLWEMQEGHIFQPRGHDYYRIKLKDRENAKKYDVNRNQGFDIRD
jgi:hypothetical protein